MIYVKAHLVCIVNPHPHPPIFTHFVFLVIMINKGIVCII